MLDHKEGSAYPLAEDDPTLGWGAIMSVGKAALDLQLEEGYLERFQVRNFSPAINDKFPISNGDTQLAEFAGLVMGPPSLDFSKANLLDDLVGVRFELIAGDFTLVSRFPGRPPLIDSSSNILRGMGLYLEAHVKVHSRYDRESGYLGLSLDWASARDFTCNLGSGDYARTMIANGWANGSSPSQTVSWSPGICALMRHSTLTL